jgi:glutathione peroxidase
MNNEFYNLSAQTLRGQDVLMSEYKGKVILIANTASKCGLTYQYEGLEALYKKYKDQGLVVLGFPCNQFGNQEPGGEKEIAEGCLINYGVSFPVFSKIEVNWENTHPIFKYLKSHIFNLFGQKIKWNFTKFLVDKNGNVVKRIAPMTKPEKLEKIIEKLLK